MAKRKFIPQANRDASGPSDDDENRHEDLGFSSIVSKNRERYINKDGTFNVVRTSRGFGELHLYQWLVVVSWSKFFLITMVFYFVINCIFASLYLVNGIEHMTGVKGDGLTPFWTAFFFSVQTLTTVGYGSLSPVGFGANLIAAMGALTGLMTFALGTGLLFARFSKPRADIGFSFNALITPYLSGNALMFRLVNKRRNMLTNLRIEVISTWISEDEHGHETREYRNLNIDREELTMLPLSWTIVHRINRASPLSVWSEETCKNIDLEIIVILEGYDDTFANIIRTHTSYKYDEIVWNAKFNPMFCFDENGHSVLEIDKVNDYTLL